MKMSMPKVRGSCSSNPGWSARITTPTRRFSLHNRKLLEEVGYIQHKGRRVDLVEDELWLYSFYDQKLPPEVVNGITLDQWRKTG